MAHPAVSRQNLFFRPAGLFCTLAGALLLACTAQPTPPSTPVPTSTPTLFPADAPLPARIRARGVLVVGIRYDLSPFGYVTPQGALAGFDVELGRELARRWLGDPQAVQFRQVRSDTAADHILAGDVDLVLTALVHSQELEERLDFGPALFEDGQALLVRASDVPTITAPGDLRDLPIAVVSGADAQETLPNTVPFTPTLVPYQDLEQALEALQQGEVRAVADLRRRLVRGLGRTPATAIVGQYTQALLAPAYAPNQPGLADLVALTFQDLFTDGTFHELYDRWFPGDRAPALEIWPGAARVTLETTSTPLAIPNTIAGIQARGRLQAAMLSRPPFACLDGAGTPAGYEVDLVQAMAERWLGDRTAVDFVVATPEEGLRMLSTGEADLLVGAVAHTREAELRADFSLTTYVGGEGLLVRAGAAPAGIADLNGQTVAVVAGTASADLLEQAARQAGISIVVISRPSLQEAIAALQNGEAVAVGGDRTDLLGKAYADPAIQVTSDRLTRVPLALALPSGDSAFRDLVNLTLQALDREGLLASVYREWFDDQPLQLPPWVGQPTHPLRLVATP